MLDIVYFIIWIFALYGLYSAILDAKILWKQFKTFVGNFLKDHSHG